MRSVPPRRRSSGREAESALMPPASASTMTCTARTSLPAPKRRTVLPSQAELAFFAGCATSSCSTFSPSLTAHTAATPASARTAPRTEASARAVAALLDLIAADVGPRAARVAADVVARRVGGVGVVDERAAGRPLAVGVDEPQEHLPDRRRAVGERAGAG